MDTLATPAVLRTVGGATAGEVTVVWRPTVGRTGLSIGPACCYTWKTRHEESQLLS
jgi:hypothetical protein